MRRTIIALTAVATLATPLAAQDRPDRGDRGGAPRQERQADDAQPPRPDQRGPRPDRGPGPDNAGPQADRGNRDAQPRPDRQDDRRGDPGRFAGDPNRGSNRGDGDPRGPDARGDRRGPDARGDDRRFQPPLRPDQRFAPGRQAYDGRDRLDDRRDGRGDIRRIDNDRFDRQRFGGNPGGYGAPGNRTGNWNRNWRDDRRYDWRGRRAGDGGRYRLGRYQPPRGNAYGYRRWSIGARLAPIYFAQDYWLDDVSDYGLPPAYGPYRWVRYYDDVLLIDLRTGLVADAIPAFFL